MHIEVNNINMNRNQIIDMFTKAGYTCATDNYGKRHIVWNIKELMMSSMNPTIPVRGRLAIAELRKKYDINLTTNGKVTNKEINNAINNLEKALGHTISKCLDKSIFDYIPSTKQNLFRKTKSVPLYTPTVTTNTIPAIIIPSNMSLELCSITLVQKGNCCKTKQLNNIMILLIKHGSSVEQALDYENMIDENGTMHMLTKFTKKTYIDPVDYKDGYIYKDAKGNEFIFVKSLIVKAVCVSPNPPYMQGNANPQSVTDFPPMFIQLKDKLKQNMHKYNKLQDFVYDFVLQTANVYNTTRPFMTNRSHKFISEEGCYYNDNTLNSFACKRSVCGFDYDITVDFVNHN